MASVLAVIIILVVTWIVAFLTLRRRVFEPMVERTIEAQEIHAAQETAQMLAHDVSRQLTLIKSFIESLDFMDNLEDAKDSAKELLPRVKNAAADVQSIVNDVLASHDQNLTSESEIDLDELLSSVAESFASAARDKKVSFSCSSKPSSTIRGCPTKIRRVLDNLLRNAFEAVKPGGSVWLVAGRQNLEGRDRTVIKVGNTDSYLAASERKNIFKVFYTRGKIKGTGLGLAIVQRVINAHGGVIRVHSCPKKGTEFVVGF